MHLPSLFALAVGLAMDAAAVSANRGFATRVLRPKHFLLVAVFFGGFQALMPWIGWMLGERVGPALEAWDHWIAFVLLTGIGLKMIHDARGEQEELTADQARDAFELRTLTLLAIATSIDALAVGVTLPMLGAPLALSLVVIGVTTAVMSALALAAGHRFGNKLGKDFDAVGGLVLVALGVKILIEHLTRG